MLSFIDYIYYSNYRIRDSAEPSARFSDAKFMTTLTVVGVFCVLINIFSTHVYDIRSIMMSHWIGDSEVYRSISNPKAAPFFWALMAALISMKGYLPSNKRFSKISKIYSKDFLIPPKAAWGLTFFGMMIFIPLTSPPDPLPYSSLGFFIFMVILQLMANYRSSK